MPDARDATRKRTRVFAMDAEPRARAADARDDEPTLYSIAFSSDAPILRRGFFGSWREILSHEHGAVDTSYLDAGASVLVDHSGDVVGTLRDARIRDGKGRGSIQFSRNPRGQEVERDVVDGIRKFVSVGYAVDKEVKVSTDAEGIDTYKVERWVPIEISVVSAPADLSVGFGRSEGSRCDPLAVSGGGSVTENSNSIEVSANEAETQRRVAIRALVSSNGLDDSHAGRFIADGFSPEATGREILKLRERGQGGRETVRGANSEWLDGLSAKDRRSYSYKRAIVLGAGLTAKERGERAEFSDEFSGVEAEVHQELARLNGPPSRGGILTPLSTMTNDERMQQRALSSGGLGAGNELVFEQAGEFIEMLRNRAQVVRSGARVLSGLQGPVGFAKQSGAVTAFWVAEASPVDVADSDMLLGIALMQPKTLQSSTAFTRQLLAQSAFGVENLVREDLSKVHALALDRGALHGKGAAGEPAGVYSVAGVGAVAFGGALTYVKLIDQQVQVAAANADMSRCAYILTPQLAGTARKTLEFAAAGANPIWTGTFDNGQIGGYESHATGQVSSTMTGSVDVGGTSHGVVFGDWTDMIVGFWTSVEVVVDPYRLKKRGLIECTSFSMCDVLLRHPESFSKGTGATP